MKKIILGLIPAMASAAIIGTGYATWTFGGKGSTGAQNVTVTTTDATVESSNFGRLTVTANTLTLKLDQGSSNSENVGASFEGSITFTLVVNNSGTNSDMIADQDYKYSFTLDTPTVNSNLAEYVEITTTNVSFEDITTKKDASDSTFTLEDSSFSVSYKSGKKPTTLSEYNTMINAIYGTNRGMTETSAPTSSTSLMSLNVSWSAVAVSNN